MSAEIIKRLRESERDIATTPFSDYEINQRVERNRLQSEASGFFQTPIDLDQFFSEDSVIRQQMAEDPVGTTFPR